MGSIAPGTRVGPYDVVSALGAGGMGEVYRARDPKLAREVAIKIIHPDYSHDRDHLSRFRREAHILASLNHPHIASVFELGEFEGTSFLVMELVEGETLHEKLTAGRPTIRETLDIARQIAAALEAAHDKGIVHRDLKPANVKLTPDGTVKVLDFGLAKSLVDEPTLLLSQPPTGTGQGVILGTAAYMSPEQARGRTVDRRADIWAFGCIFYEALTGVRPFAGETVSDTIAGILDREPDWRLLPTATPPSVVRVIRRCLEKDLNRRLRDIGDARLEIEEARQAPATTPQPVPASRPGGALAGAAAALLLAGTVIGAVATRIWTRPPVASRESAVHFVITLPTSERLTGLDFSALAMSSDASMIAYTATRGGRPQLFLRSMNTVTLSPVAGTQDAASPFFSPDGRWIAFFAAGKLKKVPVAGGPVVTICEAPVGVGGTWGANDTIVFAGTTGSGLSRVSALGGAPTRATALDTARGEFSHRWPELLPDGKWVLFAVGTVGSWDDAEIVAASIETGERRVLIHGGTSPHYSPGHLLYAREGSLMVVPFDIQKLTVTGSPTRVLQGVVQSFDGAMQVTVSRSGSLAYVPGTFGATERALFTVARDGSATPLAAEATAYSSPRLSPDGRRLAMIVAGTTDTLWVYTITDAQATQITFEGNSSAPVWTPDSRRLVFTSSKAGAPNLFWIGADGGDAEERLTTSENVQFPGSWSPDGRTLAFVERTANTGRDVLLYNSEDRTARPLIQSPVDDSAPRFSPDGRWLAYVSNESGRNEVYVVPVADPARKRRVSSDGGTEPVWAPGGRELYYRTRDRMMAVAVRPGANVEVSAPTLLFETAFDKGSLDTANYDVTADGRFIMIRTTQETSTPGEVHIILNWFVEAVRH